MVNLITPDLQEAYDFGVERHHGKPEQTYPDLLRSEATLIDALEAQSNVAAGILRWLNSHGEAFMAGFTVCMTEASKNAQSWRALRRNLWDAMDARAWLAPWDCWTSDDHLWETAVTLVFDALNQGDLS